MIIHYLNPPKPSTEFGGLVDTFTSALSKIGTVYTSYYNNLGAVNAAKAAAQAASLGTPAQQAAAQADNALSNYMPYILGIGGLIVLSTLVKSK